MHVKALDGIRGLAVLLVVLFHFGFAPTGWIGVQIFFVLSGFLITSILLNTKDLSLVSYLGRFYWRRSLRIFPLYFAVLFIAALTYGIWSEPPGFLDSLPYLATYTANFGRMRETDIGWPLTHLWSLAVEEQFYLVWPIFIYLTPYRYLRVAVALIIIGAPVARLGVFLYFRNDPEIVGRAIYGFPLSQFDAFAFGAAIVVWDLEKMKNAGRLFVCGCAVAAVLGTLVMLYEHLLGGGTYKWSFGYAMYLMPIYQFIWGYSLIDIVAMLALVCALQRRYAFRALENPAIVYLGTISYGVYIFHIPILMIFQSVTQLTGWMLFVPYSATVLAFSAVSFRWFETPFLRLKDSIQIRSRLSTTMSR